MVFSSLTFLFYFLPVVILAYFLLPYKNTVLLISSLLFYSWGEPKYILLMLLTVFINYICALKIIQNREHSKVYLVLALFFSLGALIIFKYADFLILSTNNLFKLNSSFLNLALPIGISFYTFQILTYTIDVYRDEVKVQRNFFTLLTYVSLFPQLIAGPIVRYSDVEKELEHRHSNYPMIFQGINRFVIGLSKKVIIANTLGEITQSFRLLEHPSVMMHWLYAIAFTLQLYYDFSGYSDMAIGLGKIFGFNFLENFNYPFMATSITDFWRRWHMSLGSFFRDYVYIPLGGSRVSKTRWIFNILVVWSLTGLWHGAAYNFLLWGLLFAILLMIEKFIKIDTKKHSVLRTIYVLFVVVLSFVIFDASSLSDMLNSLKNMLFITNTPLSDINTIYYSSHYLFVFIIAILGATPYVKTTYLKVLNRFSKNTQDIINFILCLLGFIICVAMLVDSNFNPFLYFRF